MLRDAMTGPRRILMTIDAVGGLWRYGIDLARGLAAQGIACVLVGFGPEPDAAQQNELRGVRDVALRWSGLPLDWIAADEAALEMWETRCSTSAAHATSISCTSIYRRRRRRSPPAYRWSSPRTPASSPGGMPCAAIQCRRTGSGRLR